MNRRLYPRTYFENPLTADMNIYELNGERIDSNKIAVLIHDVSQGGICFSSNLSFPIGDDIPIVLKARLFSGITIFGKIAWKKQQNNCYYYGFEITSCALEYYHYCYRLQNQQGLLIS
ncbi:PilZ domain-containing protein [Halalkalibacter urbisdiaboli]|uniref:PilZ domain-containing protein n=1 Tax=Halalkalibacter urbisdiaboli TaxID=1960589 RepID=UPI000B42FAC1|nr:PilZ domain-containing protein [Halalkalibacter urbisdiaboli]